MSDGDDGVATSTAPGRRTAPPAQVAKIATAGVSGVVACGLVAVMGWSDRAQAPQPTPQPPTSAVVVAATATASGPPVRRRRRRWSRW